MPTKTELQGIIKTQETHLKNKFEEIKELKAMVINRVDAIARQKEEIETQRATISGYQRDIAVLEKRCKNQYESIERQEKKSRLLSQELHEALNSDIKTSYSIDPIATELIETAKTATKNHEAILKVNDRLVSQNGKLINVLEWMTKNNNDEY